MISKEEFFNRAFKDYLESSKILKQEISLLVYVPEDSDLKKLPLEAFYNNMLFVRFDFNNVWISKQTVIENEYFKCILVYGKDNFTEYPVTFPIKHIVAMTDTEKIKLKNTKFMVTKDSKEFEISVNNSKNHLKLI